MTKAEQCLDRLTNQTYQLGEFTIYPARIISAEEIQKKYKKKEPFISFPTKNEEPLVFRD